MSNDTLLQSVADRQAITEQLYRYCRSVDRLDREVGYSIWSDNSVADYGDFYYGDGPGVIDLICQQHGHVLNHTHQMSNVIIELDGDRAGSESYITATLSLQKGEQLMHMSVWSRYVDSWVRTAEGWRLTKRIAIRDLDEIRPVTPLSSSTVGRRDREDPSYSVLG